MRLQGRKIYPGFAKGEALVTSQGISFYGGVDPQSGVIVERGHALEGQSIAGKVLVYPTGKGSTVGSYTLYRLKTSGLAPLAIVNAECETITAVGCIIAEIPCVDRIELARLGPGQILAVDGEAGLVEIAGPASPPDALRGSEPGSFAEYTMSERLPNIARRVLANHAWSPQARQGLQDLIENMPDGITRPIQGESAADLQTWAEWMKPFAGQNWLEAPWFPAEVYFFRRVLEATRYFEPGPDSGIDPFQKDKTEGMDRVLEQLHPVCSALRQGGAGERQETLTWLLHSVVWGNQADLSIWPAGGSQPANHQGDQRTSHLLRDQAREVAEFIHNQGKGLERVDFILDNVGLELAYDLLLAGYLFTTGLAKEVRFHAKPYPTYVSDATIPDIQRMIDLLAGSDEEVLRDLGLQLAGSLAGERLIVQAEDYWISPLMGWEMPGGLITELSKSDLLISKGDANYRRWVGDRHWPYDTPIEAILAYRPAPLLLLRVLKSELIAGLRPGQAENTFELDPRWMFNGNWGVIQFIR